MNYFNHIHIERASPSWKLIMQSGVGLSVTVGIPLADFLSSELGLSAKSQVFIDSVILDGMPVDDPTTAIVADGSRLALAAGLPGIAGLAMKRNSAVKALRGPITHMKKEEPKPQPGRITLALYSLVLPALGGHFLQKGLLVTPAQFSRYARFAPDDQCLFKGLTLSASCLAAELLSSDCSDDLLITVTSISDDDSA